MGKIYAKEFVGKRLSNLRHSSVTSRTSKKYCNTIGTLRNMKRSNSAKQRGTFFTISMKEYQHSLSRQRSYLEKQLAEEIYDKI